MYCVNKEYTSGIYKANIRVIYWKYTGRLNGIHIENRNGSHGGCLSGICRASVGDVYREYTRAINGFYIGKICIV